MYFSIITSIVLLFSTIIPASSQTYSSKAEIYNLHNAYCSAVENKDSLFLKKLFHDGMIITGGNGSRRDKRQEIQDALDPKYSVNYFRSRDVTVRVFDATAIVTGDLYWEMTSEGKTYNLERRFTFTYAKLGEEWNIVAQHIGMAPAATK
ncbi:MAG: nuclear transport factor 2 family protein [Bacteroidetes bacterium]|nr:MAG: nuclear transport factor 2 family protein [Bacteroidota bacterium]